MAVPEVMQLLIQVLVSGITCVVFFIVGAFFSSFFDVSGDQENGVSARLFYGLFFGMISVVVVYSLFLSGFKTVNIFIVIAAFFCLRKRNRFSVQSIFPRIKLEKIAELLLLVVVFVLLFNFLPESGYKQRDSFFYLKISEALRLTGQENTNNYVNLFSDQYHGTEAYHYFEGWLNAFLLNFTHYSIPNIQTFRIVTYTIIAVIFIYGLFYLYGVLTHKEPDTKGKLICLAFVFFMPDFFSLLPGSVARYLVFNFENNFLERPNFRLIYLFFIPVISRVLGNRADRTFIFYAVCLCTVNVTAALVVVPAVVLLLLFGKRSGSIGAGSSIGKNLVIFLLFVVAYLLFYYLFSTKSIPALYDSAAGDIIDYFKKSWKFILLTITTSLLYVGLFWGLAYYIFKKVLSSESLEFFRKNSLLVYFLGTLVVVGIVVARVFGFMENMYQVAYISYIVASLFIFLLFSMIGQHSWKYATVIILIGLAGYGINKFRYGERGSFVFSQNDQYTYSGVPYSAEYIQSVTKFVSEKKNCVGAYMADSVYYRDLYYSLRNPNVYHLPITYIMSSRGTVNDFCVSDPVALKYDVEGKLANNNYLDNAIARSFYHRSYPDHTLTGGKTISNIQAFILKNHLQYLILTPGVAIDSIPGLTVEKKLFDPNTKERFWIFADK